MIRKSSGMRPSRKRWKNPGNSLRLARSPVAPKITSTRLDGRSKPFIALILTAMVRTLQHGERRVAGPWRQRSQAVRHERRVRVTGDTRLSGGPRVNGAAHGRRRRSGPRRCWPPPGAGRRLCGLRGGGLRRSDPRALVLGGGRATPGTARCAWRRSRPSVSVAAAAARTPIPHSYLGLSTEYWALPLWSQEMPLLERAMSLVRVRGDGPLILRVGGDSADHTFWDPDRGADAGVGVLLAPKWLSQARALVRRLGVRLILDLNLITDTPGAAAQWAHAARSALPPRSIDAFEVGNEPDIYSRADWLAITAGRGLDGRLAGRQGSAGRPCRRRSPPATTCATSAPTPPPWTRSRPRSWWPGPHWPTPSITAAGFRR